MKFLRWQNFCVNKSINKQQRATRRFPMWNQQEAPKIIDANRFHWKRRQSLPWNWNPSTTNERKIGGTILRSTWEKNDTQKSKWKKAHVTSTVREIGWKKKIGKNARKRTVKHKQKVKRSFISAKLIVIDDGSVTTRNEFYLIRRRSHRRTHDWWKI